MGKTREQFTLLAVLMIAASVTAFDYGIGRVDPYLRQARWESFNAMADGTIPAPYRYRVLVPYGMKQLVGLAESSKAEVVFHRLDALFDAAAIMLLLWTLHWYLRQWFQADHALIGVLLTACTLPISLRNHFYSPYSIIEPAFLLAGLVCVKRQSYVALVWLTLLASLNRETGVLLPFAFLINEAHRRPLSKAGIARGAGLLALSAAVYILLRWWLGPAPDSMTISLAWQTNTTRTAMVDSVINVALFGGVAGWLLAIGGASRVPAFVKQMSWLGAAYVAAYLIWGVWYEVRLLMPLYPFLVPAMLAFMFPLERD